MRTLPLFPTRSGIRQPFSPKFAEFFAGIGLVRMGLEAAGWSCAFANDIDPTKRGQYEAHFDDAEAHFRLGDVHLLNGADVPDVTLATASFPCTDLSLAGGRAGIRAGESSAFWGFVEVLRQMGTRRPPLVLLENVTGFLSSNAGEDFLAAMIALNEIGYSVDPLVLDAKWFVPQSRPRLFVVARQVAAAPVVALLPSRTRPPALVRAILAAPHIRWKLTDHPEPPSASGRTIADIVEDPPASSSDWWSIDRKNYFLNQLSPRHLAAARAMIKGEQASYATAFRRVREQPDGTSRSMAELRTDGIAGCLRTPKGGSGRQILFRAGRKRFDVRLLSPRECARLMGADNFTITGSLNDALFGFGDAVCVPAVTWLAKHILTLTGDAASDTSAARALQ